MKTGPNIRKRNDGRFEARYIKGRDEKHRIIYGYCYGRTYEEAESKRNLVSGQEKPVIIPKKSSGHKNKWSTSRIRHMNLLILGAGDHGHAVYETAKAKKIFDIINFLDDNTSKEEAVGTCTDYLRFLDEYPMAFPAFGDNELRKLWIERLERGGFIIPTLIHPEAYIAPSATIGAASIVEAKATVNTDAVIEKGCIISSNAVVDLAAVVGEYSFIETGATIEKRVTVKAGARVAR